MRKRSSNRAVQAFVFLGIVALLVMIFLPILERARKSSSRLPCPTNLRQIGTGILLYSNDHGRWCPPDLDAMVKLGILNESSLTCPNDRTVRYTYIGGGRLFSSFGQDEPLAYDPLGNYGPEDGSNVLFGDGHVEYLDRRQFIDRVLKATTKPTTSTTH